MTGEKRNECDCAYIYGKKDTLVDGEAKSVSGLMKGPQKAMGAPLLVNTKCDLEKA